MQVIGKNLLNVCKLLLAVGKNEDNDKLFQAESITGLECAHVLVVEQSLSCFRLSHQSIAAGKPTEGARDPGVWARCD